tara:strand:+ start:48401 stop:48589 length:189 start_codon:yes stop_codon:yes gene_type:complete
MYNNLLKRFIHKPTQLGRWTPKWNDNSKMNKTIDWSNIDNCGTCYYESPKLEEKETKDITSK